jgi:F-type H+-transporting ATPase subunit b
VTRGFAALVALALVPSAFGAAGGGEHHAPSIGDLFWPVLNFALFLGILWRFAWPIVKAAVADRRTQIESEIAEAARVHEEARAALEGIERMRAGESAERERILAELREEARRDRAALVESARRAAERMREDARRLGESEGDRAVLEIRRGVAVEVARRAEEELRRRLGDAEQGRFIDEFVGSVGGRASR